MITLYALSQMAERITPGSVRLSATFAYAKNAQSELKVTRDNSMVLQLLEVSRYLREIVTTDNNVSASFVDFVHVRIARIFIRLPADRPVDSLFPLFLFYVFFFYRHGANFNSQSLKKKLRLKTFRVHSQTR